MVSINSAAIKALRQYRRSFISRSYRRRLTGLLAIPAKALTAFPSSSFLAVEISKDRGEDVGRLRIYNVLQPSKPESQRGLALSLIDNIDEVRETISSALTPLPPLPQDDQEYLPPAEPLQHLEPDTLEDDDYELPPHLQPQPMDDGIPMCDPRPDLEDADFVEDLAELKRLPDYDPNIYPDMIEGFSAEVLKQQLDEYDAVDMKNCDNWNTKYDPEAPFFNHDVYGWLKADMEECLNGAMPKLHERLEVPNRTAREVIVSDCYDPAPLSLSSPLSPYLFIHHVPLSHRTGSQHQDTEFHQTFERFAHMTSHENFRRTTCFKQIEPPVPRYLIIQEFTGLLEHSPWLALKKREAEHWWRKNGWDEVIVEFFKLRQEQEAQ